MRKNTILVFRSCEKKGGKARQKQKTERVVPDIRKSMKNDAGEKKPEVLQRATATYDLDCDHLGMFALFFSVGIVVNFYLSSTLFNCLQ